MEHVVLVNEIKLPKIIDTLAKFDGRKKAYIPDPQILEEVGKAKQLEIGCVDDEGLEHSSSVSLAVKHILIISRY